MIDPFDLPRELADNAFTELVIGEGGRVMAARTPGPLGKAIDTTRSRFEDERRRNKALEEELKTLRAEHENLRADRDNLQVVLDGYGEDEPPIVRGALDAQAEAERRSFVATERAERAEKDLVHVREALAAAKVRIADLAERVGTIADLSAKLERFEKLGEDLKKLSESAR